MANGETFKASIIGQLDDGTAVVFDFGYADNGGGATHLDMGIAAGNFQTLVQAKFAAALTADFTFKRYRFACVGGAHLGEIGYVEVDPAVTGALLALDRHPNEIAICMKRTTGHATRHDRGRIFFGPVASDFIDGDHPNAVVVSGTLSDVYNLLKSNLATGGVDLKPAILSSTGSWTGHVVTQASMNMVFCHRKSRRPRQLA